MSSPSTVTGGPAGNARLTAWLGLALLTGFGVELVTLLDVRALLSWHITVGVLLIPPALAKTASTLWRFARYYTGAGAYRRAGPPPLFFRLLGPCVVLSTLALLGTGVSLLLLGPSGRGLLFLHKAAFVGWGVVTGLHVLSRGFVALEIVLGRARIPGRWGRLLVLAFTAAVAVLAAVTAAPLIPSWRS